MNTQDKLFQDALHNLTSAFINFLNVVNPSGANRETEILYISQTLQNLASHLGSVPASAPTQQPVQMPESQNMAQTINQTVEMPASQPSFQFNNPAVGSDVDISGCPTASNFYNRFPLLDDVTNKWVFQNLTPSKENEIDKHYSFYIDKKNGVGLYKIEISGEQEWENAYKNKSIVFPKEAVSVEGSIAESARVETIEPGIVKRDLEYKRNWVIVKPCTIKVTPK